MFFLGIAGPLMPYFLVIGILLVFTLEVSMEKLHAREKESVENPHVLIAEESGISLPEFTCHYFDQTKQVNYPDFTENPDRELIPLVPPGTADGEKSISPDDFLPETDYSGACSGLSPPSSFVSSLFIVTN